MRLRRGISGPARLRRGDSETVVMGSMRGGIGG